MKCHNAFWSVVTVWICWVEYRVYAFTPITSQSYKAAQYRSVKELDIEPELTLAEVPAKFTPLLSQVWKASIPKKGDEEKNAHDPFRYEWGTWIDNEAILELMSRIDEVRVEEGAYDKLERLINNEDDIIDSKSNIRRIRIASGEKWDFILHILPLNHQHETRWCTGSWSVLKALTGVVEVAMLREDRNGNKKKVQPKRLRGGSDGSFSKLGAGGGNFGGEDCIKYVGGPLRSYEAKSDRTILLEIVIRPPVSAEDDSQIYHSFPDLQNLHEVLDIFIEEPEEEQLKEEEQVEENLSAKQQVQKQLSLGDQLGLNLDDQVGGLDVQLDTIVRRVLASRANPEAAKRLGISHVKGVLLSGPPGCGKTLLARELARLLGAREPQIVNGPEILDKFIGEAEKKVRDLFLPAELEYKQVGDDSALHVIILDEMDAIAKKRGSASSDTTGVRDSVVNQLLSKMDGVQQANNILVVGMTNRPELIDPALLRPGRLEVHLRVELPDAKGRRDIFRIHTAQMKENNAITNEAMQAIEDINQLPTLTDKFTGAEIAGLVRSAASFALARSIQQDSDDTLELSQVTVSDFEQALTEVQPSLGKQDAALQKRLPHGIYSYSATMERIIRDLQRFIAPLSMNNTKSSKLHSLMLIGGTSGGAGVSALGAWAASQSSTKDYADYVRFITAIDLLTDANSDGDAARAAILMDRFQEAYEMPHSLLVLDDIDQLCAGSGPNGYSMVMLATLRALLRTPPSNNNNFNDNYNDNLSSTSNANKRGQTLHIIATTSKPDVACSSPLLDLFEETIVVPSVSTTEEIETILQQDDSTCTPLKAKKMASILMEQVGPMGIKSIFRLIERAKAATFIASNGDGNTDEDAEIQSLMEIVKDLRLDNGEASTLCEVVL